MEVEAIKEASGENCANLGGEAIGLDHWSSEPLWVEMSVRELVEPTRSSSSVPQDSVRISSPFSGRFRVF